MNPKHSIESRLARELISDELFDLTLYQELKKISGKGFEKLFSELIPIETKHYAFWQNFFEIKIDSLDWRRRVKLGILVFVCRIFRSTAVHLVLEAIEIYGIRKYLSIWEKTRGTALGQAVQEVLRDEFIHEDEVVSQLAERKINPARIRSIFLGLNDGLVELLGTVSGFFAAFNDPATILAACSTVAVAGSLSMAAGAYVASSSEEEIKRIENGKARFLNISASAEPNGENSFRLAMIVGFSYFFGAAIPVLPVFFGAKNILFSITVSGVMVIFVSWILAFLSGMRTRKRILINLAILSAAVLITYAIGSLAKYLWGISV